jgi:sterol 3beta-glucosyltransferase
MKICVLALGSRGDVQPAVALSARLAERGHEVRLVAPLNFAKLAAGRGFDFVALPLDMTDELQSEFDILFSSRLQPLALIRWSIKFWRKAIGIVSPSVLKAGEGAELVVGTGSMDMLGGMLAERLGVPCVYAWWLPMLAARDFLFNTTENPLPRLPGWLNRGGVQTYESVLWLATRGAFSRAREDFGLGRAGLTPPLRAAVARGETLLLGYSDELLPRSREWPANVETTGWWTLPDGLGWTPPPELARFLAEGGEPIHVGFGSMTFKDRDETFRAVLGALDKTGARAIVAAGWGGLQREDLPASVFALDEAPHDWLFDRVAAIVHHGGAGTTGAVVRAGKPSIVTPFLVDQFAWAHTLYARGIAPEPLPHRKLTADALAAAITTALGDADMRRRAAKIGERVRAEDGVGRAVAVIERVGTQSERRARLSRSSLLSISP